ncbi:hypothetical protein AVEN_68994-1 [Araneus ventricosus]|uniref:Uncharacterized protein n=1 Tax=Araneus ventricosus TaxID=182803 RepID=A0A4Y2Q748_ARAVE|nr:hypothetical protein AVEN_68994-1 [Araneus ventricosus]
MIKKKRVSFKSPVQTSGSAEQPASSVTQHHLRSRHPVAVYRKERSEIPRIPARFQIRPERHPSSSEGDQCLGTQLKYHSQRRSIAVVRIGGRMSHSAIPLFLIFT